MMEQIRELTEWAGIFLGAVMIVLLAIAVTVSLRRNRRTIDAFDQPGLDELRICVPNYRLKAVTKKLEELGWTATSTEEAKEHSGYFHVLIKRRDEPSAAPIKQILHKLNRMLLLPLSPLELQRLGEENA